MTVDTLPTSPASPCGAACGAASGAVAMLAAHVPLSLLLDLADPAGPRSRDLLTAEAGSAEWLLR